jgi:hypothetical protein
MPKQTAANQAPPEAVFHLAYSIAVVSPGAIC